jgi:DNA-binding transcriptional ArsR family regulator
MLKYHVVDDILRALAEPTRRAIVERLGNSPASVSDLAKPFDMSLAAVVQHLQVLEETGIIASEKIGRVRTCRLEPGGMDTLALWIEARRSPAERRLDRLAAFLAEPNHSTKNNDRGKETK